MKDSGILRNACNRGINHLKCDWGINNYQFSHIVSVPGFKLLASEVGDECVNDCTTESPPEKHSTGNC